MSEAAASLMTEHEDRREWDLSGFSLTQVIFDPAQITMLIYDMAHPYKQGSPARGSAFIVITNLLKLQNGEKEAVPNPELHLSCVPLLSLMLQPVRHLQAYRDSRLMIDFDNGYKVTVDVESPYELWNSQGNGMLSDMNMLALTGLCPWGG